MSGLPRVEEAVVVDDPARVGHERIGRDEGAQGGVVVAGVVIEQTGSVGLLAGEGEVNAQVAQRGALRAIRIVRVAGYRPTAERRQRHAAEMIAVQVVERTTPLHRSTQTGADGYRLGNLLPQSYPLLWLFAPAIFVEKRFYFNRLDRVRPRPEHTQAPSVYRRQVSIRIHVAHHLFQRAWSDNK